MANIIDTHSHVLPGVDHGSPDLETTLSMIREAADRGTRTIVCTPHLYEMDDSVVARDVHRLVTSAVEDEGIPVRLLLGFEVDLTIAAGSDLDTIRSLCIETEGRAPAEHEARGAADAATGSEDPSVGDQRPSLDADGPRAIVLEMPYSGWPIFLEQTVFRLVTAGLVPILAHPERNERIQHSPDALAACLNAGAIAQGTAGSLSSMFRKQSQKAFYDLLARGWFSLLASDAHSQPQYTWSLGPLLDDLGKRLTPADRALLTEVNPARVLNGQGPIRPAPARPNGRSWRRFV